MTYPQQDLDQIIKDGKAAYFALSKFETARYKVLQHCNLLPAANLNFSPPNTRATGKMYTAKVTSTCCVCHDRHISINNKSYLLHFASLPFKCEHGSTITNLHVQEESERTLPLISLPSRIQKVEPDCLSISSGGIMTTDKLDKDKHRIQQAFDAADEAFTTLTVTVRSSNVDLSTYPQYEADHVNCLIAALEAHKEECCTFLDAHRTNLVRLSEVSEADEIYISTEGHLTVSQATNQARPETPLLDRPNDESSPSATDNSGDTVIPSSAMSSASPSSLSSALNITSASSLSPMTTSQGSTACSFAACSAFTNPSIVVSSKITSTAVVSSQERPLTSLPTCSINQPSLRPGGLASGVTQGLGLLQNSERLQAEAIRRCQRDMFETQSAVLADETVSLQTRVSDHRSRMTTTAAKALHQELALLDRKLADLSSLRQSYIANQGSQAEMESELTHTEAILRSHSFNQSTIRREIVRAEIEILPPQITQASQAPQPQVTNFLQKLAVPSFTGKVAEYPSFRQRFRDLTETGGYPLSVILEHLKLALPKEQQHLVDASNTLGEVWARLDEKYGNKTMTILTVQRSLLNIDLSKYKEFEKVERLHDEISRGLRLLAPLGAEDAIVKDLQIVSRLVEKLPESLQLEWSRQATKAGRVIEPGNTEWPKFIGWLNEERRAAILRRDYQLTQGGFDSRLSSSSSTSAKKPHCFRCKLPGHKTSDCPNSIRNTLADINHIEEDVPSDDTTTGSCNFASTEGQGSGIQGGREESWQMSSL